MELLRRFGWSLANLILDSFLKCLRFNIVAGGSGPTPINANLPAVILEVRDPAIKKLLPGQLVRPGA